MDHLPHFSPIPRRKGGQAAHQRQDLIGHRSVIVGRANIFQRHACRIAEHSDVTRWMTGVKRILRGNWRQGATQIIGNTGAE
jgi:hypothetical protein